MKQLHRMLIAPALAGAALAAFTAPLLAQTTTTAPAASERNAPASKQPTEAQDGADARAKLNAEQAKAAQAQVASNSMSEEEYQRQLQAVEDAKAKIASDQAAAQAAYEAEKVRRDAEYKAAMDKWQADVDACNAGDRTRCGPPVAAAE